ncbi:hypothetical protein MN116_008457 [Schistosoma mekongi]|uniref:Uncharacterized protein n=1 Tax=Schistosoma mekongi TaxID=38744 RepID=A0AAE1Z7M0_SCHME|nr:hypothetical protein MN116_008457 [Schistosoma mekongi]
MEPEAYFDDAYVPIHCLISEAYGFEMTQLNPLLSHLGKAQGMVNMLRSSVLLAQHKNVLLFPLDLINQHNLTQEHVLRFLRNSSSITSLNDESVKSLVCDIASLGHYHAKRVSQLSSELMGQFLSLLISVTSVSLMCNHTNLSSIISMRVVSFCKQ